MAFYRFLPELAGLRIAAPWTALWIWLDVEIG
ncbi:hypothetical protein GP2143_05450 [marine gamma proteobacterium HTCC2143]|uniref:Uncharacterized protein n=1 Tax=marine gamma proteobacterium HTCC2143 TaxID=247633 RepID=A0YBE0_9GAMM|nr:hypothetical protein GP2143_05450 [marine gamma proteobacterium HTCC2143]